MVDVVKCPRCGGALTDEKALEGHLKCSSCGKYVPLEAPPAHDLSRYLLYTLSLPERTVRSTVALASGAARETAGVLVPRAFQNSKTYEIVVRNSLRFLTEHIGRTKSSEAETAQAGDDYLARKAIGNFVDLAGLSMLHLSPMWILAIVSDVAYGSKVYAQELAVELKAQGMIAEDSSIERVDDILEAVRLASGKAAGMIDAPPLSVEELRKSLEETRDALTAADYRAVLPEAEIKSYWNEMRQISERDDVSLLHVSSAITMHSMGKAQSIAQGMWTGMGVAGGLFNETVIGHYSDSLRVMREEGFYVIVSRSYAPYIEAVWTNYSADQVTITEGVLDGSLIKRAYQSVSGWVGRRKGAVVRTDIPKVETVHVEAAVIPVPRQPEIQ